MVTSALQYLVTLSASCLLLVDTGTLRHGVPRSQRANEYNRPVGSSVGTNKQRNTPIADAFLQRSHESLEQDNPDCPECERQTSYETMQQQMAPEEFRKIMIELIKIKLLKKLNLKEPPVLNGSSLPIPEQMLPEMLRGMQRDDHRTYGKELSHKDYGEETGEATIEEISLIGEEEHHHGDPDLSRSRHFAFQFRDDIFDQAVRSAAFWIAPVDDVRVMKNTSIYGTLYVSDTNGHHTNSGVPGVPGHILVKDRIYNGHGHWMKLDVTDQARNWLRHRHHQRRLTISCKGCRGNVVPIRVDGAFRPFLAIEFKKKSHRKRRSIHQRGASGGCYLERLYINFTEIGYHTWIRHPEGYDANYCRGSCINHDVLPTYSRIMRELIKAKARSEHLNSLIAPCCAAVSTSSMTILYEEEPNKFIRSNLENMVADRCDCR